MEQGEKLASASKDAREIAGRDTLANFRIHNKCT